MWASLTTHVSTAGHGYAVEPEHKQARSGSGLAPHTQHALAPSSQWLVVVHAHGAHGAHDIKDDNQQHYEDNA